MAWEITKLCFAVTCVVGFIVTALATKPANTTEKMDACTRSFMVLVTSGSLCSHFLPEAVNNLEYIPPTLKVL
jgi:hypothetical protein